jgi:hypothetical protein
MTYMGEMNHVLALHLRVKKSAEKFYCMILLPHPAFKEAPVAA